MICNACKKLAILNSTRKCHQCNGIITNNIAVICDNCSQQHKICAICLKKIIPNILTKHYKGCGTCH